MKNARGLKQLLIYPSYQRRYILWISMTGLILIVLLNSIFYSFINENYIALVELSPMTPQVRNQLMGEMQQLFWILISVSLTFIAFVSFLALVISHRAAGPLYHFKRVFSEISSGKKGLRINLRPNDEFKEVALEFNQMMDKIEGKA